MRSGYDEESRNGRDVKIDILDDYIRSSERFRVIRVFFGVPESYGTGVQTCALPIYMTRSLEMVET